MESNSEEGYDQIISAFGNSAKDVDTINVSSFKFSFDKKVNNNTLLKAAEAFDLKCRSGDQVLVTTCNDMNYRSPSINR